jgi:two-component system sensor kinase FixL
VLSTDEHKAAFEASPDGIVMVAADGTIRGVNPMIEALFGWNAEELAGQPVEVLIPDTLRAGHYDHRARYTANPHNRPMGVGLDLMGRRKDGTTFPVEVSLSPWSPDDGGGDDRTVSVVCSVRDVTSLRRLRNFSEGALMASEEERQRIARELHDDTAQRLAALILRVRRVAEEDDDSARRVLFEAVREEIIEAAESVKRMSRGLRPPEIEELGLELALQAHIRSLSQATGFTVRAKLGVVDPYLDETAKLALYRIVQEALSNARRHAETDRASVRLAREDDVVIAEIEDRGRGFAPSDVAAGEGGLGLVGMQERATMIGGRLTVEAVPGGGTKVSVTVPLSNGVPADA